MEDEDLHEIEILRMPDDEGVERDFALLAVIEIEGAQFAVLAPADQLDADDDEPAFDLYAFHYAEVGDDLELDAIEDHELLQQVFDVAEEVLREQGILGEE